MGIDKKTAPNYVNIVFPDDKAMLDLFRNRAEADGQNESLDKGEPKKLCITNELASFNVEEYYFDTNDGTIEFSGDIEYGVGLKTWFSFSIPLSDTVLIDVLQYSMKKLNKLKTALETLK